MIYKNICEGIINIRYENTPIMVVRIVNDIDDIVKIVRFAGWQDTTERKNDVKKVLRQVT